MCFYVVWECDEFNKDRSVKAYTNTVNGLVFNNAGKLLATCSADLSIKLWNFDTLTCIKTLNGHEHKYHLLSSHLMVICYTQLVEISL
jgi:WD40 repeat protein